MAVVPLQCCLISNHVTLNSKAHKLKKWETLSGFKDQIMLLKFAHTVNSRARDTRYIGICSASQRSEAAESRSRLKQSQKRLRMNREQGSKEEEIYNIDNGWKLNVSSTEKMIEIAGVQVPVRLKQQLQSERQKGWPAKLVFPEEPSPRTTHKLLKAYAIAHTNSPKCVLEIVTGRDLDCASVLVMAGKAAGKKLVSPADMNVRPMMEVVRGAVFNIIQSLSSWSASAPSGRWLDLYSGTGSVGIEALSRGCCSEAHFVEMDPWVISQVLEPNLRDTRLQQQSVIHTSKVETMLQQASAQGASYLGGAFDYISVTPPYEAVTYTTLMEHLSTSPFLRESTFMIVEYPLKSKHEILEKCGPLWKIRDRRYGRTNVAMYGPTWVEQG